VLTIELIETDSNETLASSQIKVHCVPNDPKVHQVRFKVPIEVSTNKIYTASAEYDGSYPYPTYYGINGKRVYTMDVPASNKSITFVFFKSEKNNFLDTGGEIGQIPQILFCLSKPD